jgi:hypothetical protein
MCSSHEGPEMKAQCGGSVQSLKTILSGFYWKISPGIA